MPQKAEDFFPEGCLLPGKVVGILKSMPNPDDVEVLISIGRLTDGKSTTHPGKTVKVWTEGPIEKKKGKELFKFAPALDPTTHKVVDWTLSDLAYERDDNPAMPEAYKFVKEALTVMETDALPLDDFVERMYPKEAPHTAIIWRAWLQVKHDHYFFGTPDHVKCHAEEHVTERDWTKGTMQVVDMTEQENTAAAKKAKADTTKEARKRLLQIMNLRGSGLLTAMTEREISNMCNKAVLQRFERGDELITQGVESEYFCVVVAGELDAIQRFGEDPFSIEESQFVLTPGKTFSEEAILHQPARMTVRALKAVEVALIEVRHCEFLVNESPDALKSIQKMLNWQEDHRPVYDVLLQRKSMLLHSFKDTELKTLAKYITLKPIVKDTLICREATAGHSMYIMVRGYARAYNEITMTEKMQDRRQSSLKNLFVDDDGDGQLTTDEMYAQLKGSSLKDLQQSSLKSLDGNAQSTADDQSLSNIELGGQRDVMFHENAVAVFGRKENDSSRHRHEVKLYREGMCFEETGPFFLKRQSSIVALAGSIIGELHKRDLNPVLLNNPTAHELLVEHWDECTPLILVAEAVSKECPSAMIPKLDDFETRRLVRGAVLDDWDAGHELLRRGKPCYSIFMVLQGELSVKQPDDDGQISEIAVLGPGKTVGEVGLVVGAKATADVTCKTHCALIEIPCESAEGVILSRPDLVDYMHHIKIICGERGEALELMCEHVETLNAQYQAETDAEKLEDNGVKADPPYFSSWSEGTTVEIVEISPPIFGNCPCARGRYERCDDLLDQQLYKTTWRAFDTEWDMECAWNRVFLAKLSPSLKMQFLTEVATTLTLTNEQPSWLRYDLRETADGDVKFLAKWHMSSALELEAHKHGGLSPRSMPLGEARGLKGFSQSELEAVTHLEAWRALRPWETEKPTDWDDDEIPEKFMSKEMIAARANKVERVFHAPSIIKCFNYWHEEDTNCVVFITELIKPSRGVGTAKKAFTCLQLGNYVPKAKKAQAPPTGKSA